MRTAAAPAPDFEWIPTDPACSFRWHAHDEPCPLARWNHHPEAEIHLIRSTRGLAFVGDHVGEFEPGCLAMVGPGLPHNWVSDLAPGEVARGCHVVLQFDPYRLRQAAASLPELQAVEELIERSRRGLEFGGRTRRAGARLIERIGRVSGLDRLVAFLRLLRLLAESPEATVLASPGYVPNPDPEIARIVDAVMSQVRMQLTEDLRMGDVARMVGMSEPTFSRFFKRNTGSTFVDYVRKLRIAQACKLLADGTMPITDICFEVGYRNISNFNRRFLAEKGMTPSRYRRLMARVSA
jgi:AraC-like DNA-binding protein